MRIGIVCPYSLDIPGGVQNHVKDLAEALLDRGHHVSVLAPSEGGDLPAYVVPTGRAVAVPYNGAVAGTIHRSVSSFRASSTLSTPVTSLRLTRSDTEARVKLESPASDGGVVSPGGSLNSTSRLRR